MRTKIIAGIALLVLASNMSFANSEKASGASSIPATTETIVVKQSLEVVGINHDERWVELKDSSGFTQKIKVGDEVRNFDQMTKGDIVNIVRSNTIEIKAFDADAINVGKEAGAIFARAAEGQKPGVAIVDTGIIVLKIAAIDLKNSLVTLEDETGNQKIFQPKVAANLKKVKVGDKVAIMFLQTFSITVDK